jgi:NADPH:quinone reductase-like Zn-dependent oxidoreductase
MKANRVHRFAPPDVIVFEDVAQPAAREGQVVVRVRAASVGPSDAWIRAGRSVVPHPLPLTLGSDLSGIVETVGAGVTGYAPGDEVFGVTNAQFTGACAEHAVVSAGRITRKLRALDLVTEGARRRDRWMAGRRQERIPPSSD